MLLRCALPSVWISEQCRYVQVVSHVKEAYLQDLVQLNVGCIHVLLWVAAPLYYPLRIPGKCPTAD